MFQRLMVPLDGSSLAEQALPVAARLAKATGGSLLLVQVVSLPIDYSGGLSPVPVMTQEIVDSELQRATNYLATIVQQPQLAGIDVATDVLYGFPAQQLAQTAEAHECDLIVLCSHGRTGLSRWALGSVALSLIHQSTVPILVLHQPGDVPPMALGHALSALVPLDGSALSEAALAPAEQLVSALSAPALGTLHLSQVVSESNPAVLEEALQQARQYLATTVAHLQQTAQPLHLTFTTSVERESDVASALVKLAEKEGAGGGGLIAISTHGRGGLQRWVMGSITERILTITKLPLLIVRPSKYEVNSKV
jgi:nucleotide-binding universal stress UspA family protein